MKTLVLLPGMDGTGELFGPLLRALPSSIQVLVLNYPKTECLGYIELEAVVRAALPSGSYFLLGESFSGPIAISIASKNPAGLLGVILCCSFASSPRPLVAVAAPALSLPIPVPPTLVIAAALLGKFSSDLLRRALQNSLVKVAPKVLRHRLVATLRVNVTRELSQLKVPLLYLQASEDWLVPRSAAKEVVSALPSAKITQIHGPHMLLQVNPAESARAIQTFMSSIANAA